MDSSGNGHRLKQFAPRYPTAAFGGGGFRGSTTQKPGKSGETAGPIGNKYCTYNTGELTKVEQIVPMRRQGEQFDGVK